MEPTELISQVNRKKNKTSKYHNGAANKKEQNRKNNQIDSNDN